MQNKRVREIKLGIGLCGNSSSCAPERGEKREEEEEGGVWRGGGRAGGYSPISD